MPRTNNELAHLIPGPPDMPQDYKTLFERIDERFIFHIDILNNPETPIKERAILQTMSSLRDYIMDRKNAFDIGDTSTYQYESYKHIAKEALKEYWQKVKGTYLSYTSLPNSELVRALLQLAVAVCQDELDNPGYLDVLSLIMPDINLEGCSAPSDYGLSGFDINTDLPLVEQCILTLNQHIINDKNTALIPVWTLLKMDTNHHTRLDNLYYDYQSMDESETILSPLEVSRIYQHSPHARALRAAIDNWQQVASDESHLLGQLLHLAKQLYANSVDGIGKETAAGSGGNVAIGEFLHYFERLSKEQRLLIPQVVLSQIDKLERCYNYVDSDGNPRIKHIETCLATRRKQLLSSIKGYGDLLCNISISANNKVAATRKAYADVSTRQQQLHERLNKSTYEGQDTLPLTIAIIELYQLNKGIHRLSDITRLFDALSADEIKEYLLKSTNDANRELLRFINTADNLLMIMFTLSKEKCAAFIEPLSRGIYTKFYRDTPNKLSATLDALDEERAFVLITALFKMSDLQYDILYKVIGNTNIVRHLFSMLSDDEKRILCNQHKVMHDNRAQRDIPKVLLHNITSEIASLDLILPYIDSVNLWRYLFNNEYKEYYSIDDCKAPLLLKLLQALPEDKIQSYLNKQIAGVVRSQYHAYIEVKKILLDDIEVGKELIGLLSLDLILMDKELHEFAMKYSEVLQQKLNNCTQLELRKYLTQKISNDCLLIHVLAANHGLLKLVLERLPREERLDFIMLTTDEGESVLDKATEDNRCLRLVLEIYPQSERLNAVLFRGGIPLLHEFVEAPEKFKIIFNSLTLAQKMQVIDRMVEKSWFGFWLAHAETVLASLSSLPKDKIKDILTREFQPHKNRIYTCPVNIIFDKWEPNTLHQLIDMIDKKHLWKRNFLSDNVFYPDDVYRAMVNKPSTFKKIFTNLPLREKCEVYSTYAWGNDTFISLANNDIFIFMIESLPLNHRIKACLLKDKKGKYRLHQACEDGCYDVVESILKLIPRDKIADVLRAKNHCGQSMINLSMQDKELLKLISRYFPRGFIFNTDGKNTSLLHQAMRDETKLDVLETTLELLGPLDILESCSIQSLGFRSQPTPLTITANPGRIAHVLQQIPNPWLRYQICCYSDGQFSNVFINCAQSDNHCMSQPYISMMPEAKQTEIMLKLNLINRLKLNPANKSMLLFWAKQVKVGGTAFNGVKIPHQIKLVYKVIIEHFDDDFANFKQAIRDAFVTYNHSWSAFFKADKCFNSCAMQALKAHADVTNVEDFRALTHE